MRFHRDPVPYEGVFPLDAVSELAFERGGDDELELFCLEDKDETEHFGIPCVGDPVALAPTQPDDHFDAEVANGLPPDCFVIERASPRGNFSNPSGVGASGVQRGEGTDERARGSDSSEKYGGDDASGASGLKCVRPCAATDHTKSLGSEQTPGRATAPAQA